MFEDLTLKLEGVFKRLRGQGKLTEANIAESLREVEKSARSLRTLEPRVTVPEDIRSRALLAVERMVSIG